MHVVRQLQSCCVTISDSPSCKCCRGRGANPIAHVLQALGEDLELLEYDQWQVLLPEGTFMTKVRSVRMTCIGHFEHVGGC